MEKILRTLIIAGISVSVMLLFLLKTYGFEDLEPAFKEVFTWIIIISIMVGMSFFLFCTYFKKIAVELRDMTRYYNQIESKMQTETVYSEVFSKISELTEVFSNTHNLESVLNEAVKTLKQVLKINIITLQLYSDEEDKFFLRIEEGSTDIDLGDEIKEDVIEKGRSRLINELDAFKSYPTLKKDGYKSIIIAPLTKVKPKAGMVSIGLIAALSKERRDFTSQDLSLLTAFSRHASLIIQNTQLYLKTQEMAIRDGLTNLYNHRHFQEELDKILKKAQKTKEPLSLIMADIDNFKNYNDTHGHPKGDIILRQIGELLINNTRGSDIVARYGGEEFVIILPDTDKHGASQLVQIVKNKIEEHDFPDDGTQPQGRITLTYGVAEFPDEAKNAMDLIQLADDRLYKGKNEGKDRIVL